MSIAIVEIHLHGKVQVDELERGHGARSRLSDVHAAAPASSSATAASDGRGQASVSAPESRPVDHVRRRRRRHRGSGRRRSLEGRSSQHRGYRRSGLAVQAQRRNRRGSGRATDQVRPCRALVIESTVLHSLRSSEDGTFPAKRTTRHEGRAVSALEAVDSQSTLTTTRLPAYR